MEASALQAPAVHARSRASIGGSLLRLRSDEQLVALFRAGDDEAFRAIHDRYRQRLFAYTRQMLAGRQDAEDALQDVFIRAYSGLRANEREVALRAWLYRVAHNRCVDELRRPLIPPAEVFELISAPDQDPVAQAERRDSLRRLIADVRRLPGQQRSALLMRELSGMSYVELAEALETTVPAVKSLLVRARIALARAIEARDTACAEIREELVLAHDRRVRPNATARRHMRDCAGCREFRHEMRGVSRQLAAVVPALGPIGLVAKALGVSFGSSAGGGAAVSGGTVAAGGATASAGSAVGTGGLLSCAGGLAASASHVATLIVATVVTAGGAVEIQRTIAPAPAPHPNVRHSAPAQRANAAAPAASPLPAGYYVSHAVAAADRPPVSATAAALPAPVPAPVAATKGLKRHAPALRATKVPAITSTAGVSTSTSTTSTTDGSSAPGAASATTSDSATPGSATSSPSAGTGQASTGQPTGGPDASQAVAPGGSGSSSGAPATGPSSGQGAGTGSATSGQ